MLLAAGYCCCAYMCGRWLAWPLARRVTPGMDGQQTDPQHGFILHPWTGFSHSQTNWSRAFCIKINIYKPTNCRLLCTIQYILFWRWLDRHTHYQAMVAIHAFERRREWSDAREDQKKKKLATFEWITQLACESRNRNNSLERVMCVASISEQWTEPAAEKRITMASRCKHIYIVTVAVDALTCPCKVFGAQNERMPLNKWVRWKRMDWQ